MSALAVARDKAVTRDKTVVNQILDTNHDSKFERSKANPG